MFSKAEAKEFITKLGKHWFFPDFNNKLTWWVVGTGVGVVVFSPPVWMEIFNWCLEQLNTNTGANLVLTKLGEGPGAGFGVALIGIGLVHNVAVKHINFRNDALAYKKKLDDRKQDKQLFEAFLSELPSDCPSVLFLKEHDFGNSFSDAHITSFENHLHKWQGAESRFIDAELESARAAFYNALLRLDVKLGVCSPVWNSSSRLSAIPDAVRDDFSWPTHVQETVDELNKLGSEAYALHQKLILIGRGICSSAA